MEKCMLSSCNRIFFARNEIPKSYEVTLPDYCQGIRKAVKTDVIAVVENASYSDGLISVNVAVNVRILYLSEQNGHLKSVTFPFDFEHTVDASKISGVGENPPELDARACIVAASSKPKGTRALEIKLNIALSASLYRCDNVSLISAEDYPDAELRTKRTDATEQIRLAATDRPLKEEITLDAELPAVAEIVDYTLHPLLNNIYANDGTLKYEGKAMFKCTYRAEPAADSESASDEYIYLSKELPFSGEIASEKIKEGDFPCASVALTLLETTSSFDPYGENRIINISAAYDIYADAFSQYEIEYTDDGYCAAYECEFEKNVYNHSIFSGKTEDRTEISEKIPADKTALVEITDTSVFLSNISCEEADGSVNLNCKAAVYIMGSDLNGIPDCMQSAFNVKIPLSSAGEMILGRRYIVNPQVLSANASIADGEITVNATIDTKGVILDEHSFEAICSADIAFDSPKPICRSEYIIYYPDKGETLWDIAKKYEIPQKTLANANGMESEELNRKTVLIPCAME